MRIAVFSDIHDNLERWQEVASVLSKEKIKVGICCGDITNIETLSEIAKSFDKLYLSWGNADYPMIDKIGLLPENVDLFDGKSETGHNHHDEFWMKSIGRIEIGNKKIIFTHTKFVAQELAREEKPDVVFYGHTHTPWEEKIGKTLIINPGEICGRYGRPSFAIFDLSKMKAHLKLLK